MANLKSVVLVLSFPTLIVALVVLFFYPTPDASLVVIGLATLCYWSLPKRKVDREVSLDHYQDRKARRYAKSRPKQKA